ncbi:MAG: hypothetical protein ABR589_09890 [Chthoniobacterales bacterium]
MLKLLHSARRHALRIFAIFACFAAFGCDEIASDRVLAQVLETSGKVLAVTPSSRRTLGPGDVISTGERLESAEGATATISLLPGMVLQLNSGTAVTIDQLLIVKSGNDFDSPMRGRQGRLQLERGSICMTTPQIFGYLDLSIGAAAGAVEAYVPAVFYVGRDNDRLRLIVARGEVNLVPKNRGESQVVREREYLDCSIGSGEVLSGPRSVEDTTEAMTHFATAIATEEKALRFLADPVFGRPPRGF